MNRTHGPVSDEPAIGDAMRRLLTRHSVGPRHLLPPAPTEEQIWLATLSALRGPDHQKLIPFRFVRIPEDTRPLLGDLFADFARRNGKSEEEVAVERGRATLAPMLLAFVTRIEPHHPRVPPHEQWLAAGGALSNFLTALHMMGYGAKMLSGRKAQDAAIRNAFCESGETLVGWIAVGTPSTEPHPRHNDNPDAILRDWRPSQQDSQRSC